MLATEVTTIVDMPVAMAIFTASSVSMPRWCSMKVRMGMRTRPPPTPSKPAKNPVKIPRMAKASKIEIKGASNQ